MKYLFTIGIILGVITFAIFTAKLLAPIVLNLYVNILRLICEIIEQITYSRYQKVKCSNTSIYKKNSINIIQNLRQFIQRINKHIENRDIKHFNYDSNKKLDNSSLSITPHPTKKLISNPIAETTKHGRTTISGENEHVNHKQTEPKL